MPSLNIVDAACNASCYEDVPKVCEGICTASSWLSHPVHADANPHDCDMLVSISMIINPPLSVSQCE